MHDSNHRDDFEEYLREHVDSHRMYPSERVWQNIRGKVHTPKKWPALSIFTVLIISGLLIGTILNKPVPDAITPNFAFSQQSPHNDEVSNKINEPVKDNAPLAGNNYAVDQITSRTINTVAEKIRIDNAIALQLAAIEAPARTTTNITDITVSNMPYVNTFSAPYVPGNAKTIAAAKSNVNAANANMDDHLNQTSPSFTFRNIDNYFFNITSRLRSILNSGPAYTPAGSAAFFQPGKSSFNYSYHDYFELKALSKHKDILPSLKNFGRGLDLSGLDFRFYLTPSVSYRRLKENTGSAKQSTDASSESSSSVNPSVAINQSPALGYETGLGLGYKLNNKFTLTGGVQFNISQYNIKAFTYTQDASAAVTSDEDADAENTVSSLKSESATKPLGIKNRYFQLSVPVGIEWNILHFGNFSWGLGSTIQPTYTFNKQPLIISSSYKNYTNGSTYVRNWNVNANLETFLGYTTGSYRWQIGPQLRYQVLPSLVDKYPNKEYLVNYGIKIGVVKQLK
ncbi:hypothetical protein [Parafilimonas sp.]|uniref:hypothetical protein n=1 Tax=Parafilimonas sp. TaxID=1969739 RepID=UPI0039E4E167